MEFEEIIKDSKIFQTRLFQSMIAVLISGALLAYFRTSETEIWLAGICAVIAIILYRKHRDLSSFIDFLEDNKDNHSKTQDDNLRQ